jgi:hypothetical protein
VSDPPDWLPELILLEDYGGNWHQYVEGIYRVFREDFVLNKPYFRGRRLGLKRHPLIQGREITFWHMISEGQQEEARLPDLRRCERVCWISPIIENSRDPAIKAWKNRRRNESRICLWLEQHEYLVVLADRGTYILPWTAYDVTRAHQKARLQKDYERARNAGTAL